MNFFFENTYAAIIVIIKLSTTVRTVTINEFKKYRDIGIPVEPARFVRFLKLSNVGLCTKIVGGNLNNSPSGLNALFIKNTTGIIMNIDKGNAIAWNLSCPFENLEGFILLP